MAGPEYNTRYVKVYFGRVREEIKPIKRTGTRLLVFLYSETRRVGAIVSVAAVSRCCDMCSLGKIHACIYCAVVSGLHTLVAESATNLNSSCQLIGGHCMLTQM